MEVGDKIKDNDPRMTNRVLEIVSFIDDYRVLAKDSRGARFSILCRRIFREGKPRKSGFTLLPNDPASR